MDLLNRLNRQTMELRKKHVDCKDQRKRELFLRENKAVFSQYLKHNEWLKALEA